jgi:cyclopropane-fatty-acyl-phospholipid synthase
MGFDEAFERMWRFYLAYTEAGFRERRIGNVQLMLAGPAFRGENALLRRASAPNEAARDEIEERPWAA